MNFEQLIERIDNVHTETQKLEIQQVNSFLTIRNILIGFYIVEFEQNGMNRADHGANSIEQLTQRLKHIKNVSTRQLYRFRDLHNTYPQIFSTVLRKFKDTTLIAQNILPTQSAEFELQNQMICLLNRKCY